MQTTSSRKILVMIIHIYIIIAFGCAGKPQEESPGLCALSCTDAVIGSTDFKIEPVNTGNNLQCLKSGTIVGIAQFRVFKTLDFGNGQTTNRMIPAISVHPIIEGVLDAEKTHSENGTVSGGVANPAKWSGISTPKSQWCSDSCGLITIEYYPKCLEKDDNIVNIQLTSGGLASTKYSLTIKKPTQ